MVHPAHAERAALRFDTAAGRYIVLCFFASASDAQARAALQAVAANRALFDDEHVCFFGVSADPADEQRLKDTPPGIRFFFDFDGAVGRLYGALPIETDEKRVPLRRSWIVIDPALKVLRVFAFSAEGSEREAVFAYIKSLPPPQRFAGFPVPAPVLAIPNLFEPAFCEKLISLYEAGGGTESGFMREVEGKTVLVVDPKHKRRRDFNIEDAEIIRQAQTRVQRRLLPDVKKVFQFGATRMERYIVSCYLAEDQGHFRPHRDNITKGTAHRRFAVSVNLNEDFDGGELSFPEYGAQRFKMPAGCAVVFSCSLLHTVSPVTRGRRYAFLPFLYDDDAARIRLANNQFLDAAVPAYRDPEIEQKSIE